MKVKEAIEILQKLDPDLVLGRIETTMFSGQYFSTIESIEEIIVETGYNRHTNSFDESELVPKGTHQKGMENPKVSSEIKAKIGDKIPTQFKVVEII